ncbi:peptide/nickel transport system substrate-binding protein [Paenibacillus endophyticus]|uniref:Peptide/nickel transport system substrate-binding protein n=1 Tax=Paenibacillus endophyticus TaxID=1294268 RepID=A0A7W5C8K8_9BACL|nr:ABC transporter substrate-binding protein [Paenibacillus endophyticus]MBB3153122.1 peptide/nickel transport system substrate-binding protein [Paenibacillus endophyticus]
MKKIGLTIISVLAILLIVNGCSAAKPTTGTTKADSLIVAIGAEPDTGFDPTKGWGRYGSPLFQSTLLKRDDDLKIEGDLAKSYEVSEDGLTWTVQLRGDVVFSDGKPLTSEDVKFTFDTSASNGSAIDLTNLASVTAGENEVRFQLKKPQSTFVYFLITTGIVPKHAYSSSYAEQPIGSGPFTFVQWDRGQQLIVEANEHYYGKKPSFHKLTFLFLNEDAAFAAAKAGSVDVAYIPSAFSGQEVAGMRLEAVKTVDNRGIAFPYVKAGGKTDKGYAIGNDVTADKAIRLAINTVINREQLVEGVLEGYGSPAYTANDGLPWWNEDTKLEDHDTDAALRILKDGGWSDNDNDGVVEKDGLKAEFTLLYPAGDVTRQSLALAAAEMVKDAGIRINVEGKSWDELEKLMHANAILLGWGSHDPLEMYNLYSSDFGGVDYYNTGYYNNPAVDKWFEQALEARTEEESIEYWKKAQWDGKTGLSVKGDAPWAWLVNIDHLYLVKDGLDIGKQRIQPHGHGWPVTDNIESWGWK